MDTPNNHAEHDRAFEAAKVVSPAVLEELTASLTAAASEGTANDVWLCTAAEVSRASSQK